MCVYVPCDISLATMKNYLRAWTAPSFCFVICIATIEFPKGGWELHCSHAEMMHPLFLCQNNFQLVYLFSFKPMSSLLLWNYIAFFLMGKKEKYKVIERGVMNLWTRSGVRGSLADLVEIRHDHMGKKGFCQFSGSPYTACIRCVCLEPYSSLAHLRLDSQLRHF